MTDSFGLFTTNSILSENSTESEASPSHYNAILEFPIRTTFYPPLKHCQTRDRIWTRIYPDGSISIHEYKLHDQIGKGSYAEVYTAENTILRKKFVLRMIDRIWLAKSLGTQEAADNFLWSAASLMDRIQHPNVVRLYEVFFNLLVVPTPYIRQDDVKTTNSIQKIPAGIIYSNFDGLFSSSQSITIDSFCLNVSTSFSKANGTITYDMIKSILSPAHVSQVFSVNGGSVIRSSDDIELYANKFIYVIERCHMKDLHSNLKQLTLRDIIIIFYQIAYGLQHLHSLLIVHHDIKLENMLIDNNTNSLPYSSQSIGSSPSTKYTQQQQQQQHQSHSSMYGIDISNLYTLYSPSETTTSDTDSVKGLCAWIKSPRTLASNVKSSCLYSHEISVKKTTKRQNSGFRVASRHNLTAKHKSKSYRSKSDTEPCSNHAIPPVSLGSYDSVATILETSSNTAEFAKIAPFYIYYSLIFSNQFDSKERQTFDRIVKRENINTYSLIAKLSDFDTAKDLSVHGKALPSLQDLLGKISRELITVFIDVFTGDLQPFLTDSDFLEDFLDDFFFSTINYEAESNNFSMSRRNYYVSHDNLDQLSLIRKSFSSMNEIKSAITSSSRCGHLQETFALSTSSSHDLSFTKSTLYTDTTEKMFGPDQNISDFIVPTSITNNDIGVFSGSMSSTTPLMTIPTDGSPLQINNDNILDSSTDSDASYPLNINRLRSSDADKAYSFDAEHQEHSCSTLVKNAPILHNDIQGTTSSHSSPSYVLRYPMDFVSKTTRIMSFQKHNVNYKSCARRLPRVYKTTYFSGSQRVLSRKSSSAKRLYLHYFVKYLVKLSVANIHDLKIIQELYFLIELLNRYFTTTVFEDKLSERLTTIFCSSEFICHHPLSRHTFPAYLSSTAGTRKYMPPESLRIWNTPSTATPNLYMGIPSDVWQFGITLYTVLIGKHREAPLQRSSDEAMQISIHLSILLADLLCGLLAPSPMQRYTMVEVVNHPFFDPNNFPISIAADQLFTIDFSSKYTLHTNNSTELLGDSADTHQHNRLINHNSVGSSDPCLRSTLFAGALYVDSLPFSSHTFSPQAFASNNIADKIQAHIDSKNIRKNVDNAICFLVKNNMHGQNILQMSLRLRKYHFWITIRRRDKLVRENRRLLRRSSISNDEIYSLLIQTPHNSKQLLLAAAQYSKMGDSNTSSRLTRSDDDIVVYKHRNDASRDDLFENSLSENNVSISSSTDLVKAGLKRSKGMKLYETTCSSTSNLPIYNARPRKFLNDDNRNNNWSSSKISAGQFDLMNVAAGDNVLDQLHDEIYLMLNIIPWKSSFVRAMPYIHDDSLSKTHNAKRKPSFHAIFNTNGTSFTEINPFIDIEVNIKELSMGTNVAFSKLFNFFSLGLLNDITFMQDSGATTVSTRSLEYIFSNSLLKSTGNIWGLVKALKSIQVGFLLECLVSTVPYFEKLTISRLTWINHLCSTLKVTQGDLRGCNLHPSTTTGSCSNLRYANSTIPLLHSDHPISPIKAPGHSQGSLYRRTSAKLTTSGMSKVFINQGVRGETTTSSSIYTIEAQSCSAELASPAKKNPNSSNLYDNSVDFSSQLLSSPSSIPSFIENDSETMRCYYSVTNNNDSYSDTKESSPTANGLATIIEEDRQISMRGALITVNLSSINQSTFSQLASPKMLIHSSELSKSETDQRLSAGIFPFDDLCCHSRSKTASECQSVPITRSASTTTINKIAYSFAADIQLNFRERLQERFGESITSGYSISEYGNDTLAALNQSDYRVPSVVRHSSAMINGADLPTCLSQHRQQQDEASEIIKNDQIMLLHADTERTKGISELHTQIRNIWTTQTNKTVLSTGDSSGQLTTKGISINSSQRVGFQGAQIDPQEKSDSVKVVPNTQGNKLPLRKHGSTTALAGILSEMSMQCKAIERMSRFVSMRSSSCSSSSDSKTILSTTLPGREKTSESFCDHELPEFGGLRLDSTSPIEPATIPNIDSKNMLSGTKAPIKLSKTILNAPVTGNNSFTSRNSHASSGCLYDKANVHLFRSSACVSSNYREQKTKEVSTTISSSNNDIPPGVLDIFDSAAPREDSLHGVSVAANVTKFLGLDVNNLDDIEIEYSTSTTK